VATAGAAFKKALIEAARNAELSYHQGYDRGEEQPAETTNHRNGVTAKTELTGDGRMRIETPPTAMAVSNWC
jgi:putative transposase